MTDSRAFVWTPERRFVAAGLATVVAGWITAPLHGVPVALVALAGAVALTWPGPSRMGLKQAVGQVEWELILFLAATMALGEAILGSGVASWAAGALVTASGGPALDALAVPVAALAALGAHLLITSRTARATVLLPTVALPLSTGTADPTTLILVVVMGTGFCQTLTSSAKPVALFGGLEVETFGRRDLMRLSLALLPMMAALLIAFGYGVWPPLVRALAG